MIKIKAKREPRIGDMRYRYKTAWIPTKVEDYLTGEVYWLWLGDYYVVEKYVEGCEVVSDYWDVKATYLSKLNFQVHEQQIKELRAGVGKKLDEALAAEKQIQIIESAVKDGVA